MLVVNEDYEVNIIDFSNGNINSLEVGIEEYCRKENKTLLLVEKNCGKTSVVAISGQGRDIILRTDMDVADSPVFVDGVLYFIAKDNSFKEEISIPYSNYEGWFMYKYANGNIQKAYTNEIDHISPIIAHDESLFVVERIKNNDSENTKIYSIISYDTNTEKAEIICNGRKPCWIEQGNSFLCVVNDQYVRSWSGAIVNIKTKDIVLLKEQFDYSMPAVIKNNKMFYWDDDITKPWMSESTVPTIVDLVSFEKNSVKKYQGVARRLFGEESFEDLFYDSVYCEWIEQ